MFNTLLPSQKQYFLRIINQQRRHFVKKKGGVPFGKAVTRYKDPLDDTADDDNDKYKEEIPDYTDEHLGGGPTLRFGQRRKVTYREFKMHEQQQEARGRSFKHRHTVQWDDDMIDPKIYDNLDKFNIHPDGYHKTDDDLDEIGFKQGRRRVMPVTSGGKKHLEEDEKRIRNQQKPDLEREATSDDSRYNTQRFPKSAWDPKFQRRRTIEESQVLLDDDGDRNRWYANLPEEDDTMDDSGLSNDDSGIHFTFDPDEIADLPNAPFDDPVWNHVRPLDYSMLEGMLDTKKTTEEVDKETKERQERMDAVLKLYNEGKTEEWKTVETFRKAVYNGDEHLILWLFTHDCPWDPSVCASAAAGDQLTVLQFLRAYGCDWDTTTCAVAATLRSDEILRWARENGAEWDEDTAVNAACNPNDEILQYVRNNSCPWDDRVCSMAAYFGLLDNLEFARKRNCDWDHTVCTNAASQGHIHILQWARRHGCDWNIAQVCAMAALNGHLNIIQWVYANSDDMCAKEWNEMTCDGAAWKGHLKILQWVRAYNCPWDASTCASAAHNGHWILLQWAFENGCPWNAETCANISLHPAISLAKNTPLSMLQWARANGCDWDEQTCANAALSGNLEVLKYARSNGCPWDSQTCSNAAKKGHLDVLQWAHENGCPWDHSVCAQASGGGNLHVLQWLRTNCCPWDSSTCSEAALNGHLHILQWARENGCDWDVSTCSAAASIGRLDILEWARKNGCPWDEDTCANAALNGHLHILRWARRGCEVIREPVEEDIEYHDDNIAKKKNRKHKIENIDPNLNALDEFDNEFDDDPDELPESNTGDETNEPKILEEYENIVPRKLPPMIGKAKYVIITNEEECCPWDIKVCAYAAKNDHLDVLQWARNHGCDWDSNVLLYASFNRNYDILYWALSNGCDWDGLTMEDLLESKTWTPNCSTCKA